MRINSDPYLPVYVVSLPGESARKSLIRQQLNGYPGKWEFLDAVIPGISAEVGWNSDLDPKRSLPVMGRLMTRGEFGCSHSHLKLMKMILQDGHRAAIILEDDAIISGDIFLVCEQALKILTFDVLILGYSKVSASALWLRHLAEPIHTIASSYGRQLGFAYRERRSGTVGYLITAQGASKLLNIQKDVATVADDWPFFKSKGLKIAHIFPSVVFEDTFTTVSSIADERLIVEQSWKKKFIAFRALARVVRGALWSLVLTTRSATLAKQYIPKQ